MNELRAVKSNDDTEFLNVTQAAAFLGVKPATIYSWTMRKSIPHYKLKKALRFTKTDLIQFMEGLKVEAIKQI